MCRHRGFTLVELLLVLVIMGVVSAYAVPRMIRRHDVDAMGLHDQALATLRYAHATAIAQRRSVCVNVNGGSLQLSVAAQAGVAVCGLPLAGPQGQAQLTVPHGVAWAQAPAGLVFDALGQPLDAATLAPHEAAVVWQVAGHARSITVEARTGYVHE
ncbi:MAG: prepilin-type N-terminal cleavage/methylation domain-containing protein [Rhodoferax sp.]|nr:prepilin-type N-terminal cleavage/methylation domain-containing protein [Rhodoferax sp.]